MQTNNKNRDKEVFRKADFDRMTLEEKADLFVNSYRVPQKKSKADVFAMLQKKMDSPIKEKPFRSLRIVWSAAASIAIIAVLATVYFRQIPKEIIVSRGQHLEYQLPDGSEVTVNSDSKITFTEVSFDKKRKLKLEGEAYFSVQKGAPFVVETPRGIVEVLGTTLNIQARENHFEVACLSGKVRVTAGNQSADLIPGEKVELLSGILQKTGNHTESQLAGWKTGEFNFDNKPLISIFEEMERQFNIKITTNDIGSRFYTGSFNNQNLADALETVCLPMSLDYEIRNGNQVFISIKKE